MTSIRYALLDGSLGTLLLRAQDETLTGLFFPDQAHVPAIAADWTRDDGAEIFAQTLREVNEFAEGRREEFTVSTRATGTPFQMRVWQALAGIPFGETASYGEIARRIGSPSSVRAVGAAVGRNPLTIIVPCHRVIGSTGSLTGYAGGLDRKRRLLALERADAFASCAAAAY